METHGRNRRKKNIVLFAIQCEFAVVGEQWRNVPISQQDVFQSLVARDVAIPLD